MPKQGRLERIVLEAVSEGVDALGAVDGGPEGKEIVLSERGERDSEALTEESEQMALVVNL